MLKKAIVLVYTLIFTLFVVPSFAEETKIYQPTKQLCNKKQVDKVKNNYICLKNNKKYKWHTITINNNVSIKETNIKIDDIEKSYKNVVGGFYKYNSKDIKINVLKSPNTTQNNIDIFIDKYNNSLNYYGKKISNKTTLIFFTELEIDWWKEQITKIENSYNYPHGWNCQFKATDFCAYGSHKVNFPILYHMVGTTFKFDSMYDSLIDHEAVHIYQRSNWHNSHKLCWGNEGYANFIGLAHSSLKIKNIKQIRNNQILQINSIFPNYKNFNQNDWISGLKFLMNNYEFCITKKSGYSIGMLIFEYLYLTYDFDKVEDMIIDIHNNGYSLNDGLLKYFNITEDMFINDLSLYFTKSIN